MPLEGWVTWLVAGLHGRVHSLGNGNDRVHGRRAAARVTCVADVKTFTHNGEFYTVVVSTGVISSTYSKSLAMMW